MQCMLVTERQTGDEFTHEFIQLIIRQSETFLNHLQHHVKDELKRMPKGDICKFIDHIRDIPVGEILKGNRVTDEKTNSERRVCNKS